MSHDAKNDSVLKIALNLTFACIISGVIIAGTYYFTADTAVAKSIMMKNDAMKSLVKEATDFEPIKGKTEWYSAKKAGEALAYVVPSESKGYGGTIKMLVAVKPDKTVMAFNVLESKETPGLGDKASQEPFITQFPGKTSDHLTIVKDPSNKTDIQAISGATISSRAVTKGIKLAVDEVTEYLKEANK